MIQNKLTLDNAKLLLVENMLVSRKKDKSLAQNLMKKLEEDLTISARNFLILNGVFKSEKAAYICVNALGVLLHEIKDKSLKGPLSKLDCKYVVSPELREEIEHEWFVGLAEVD